MSLAASPIRYPDLGSRTVMTRRAWWLVVLNVLMPGSAQVLAGNKKLGRIGIASTLTLWVLVVIAAVAALLWQAEPTATVADLYQAMQASSLDMAGAGFDHRSGHGFIQADQALVHLREKLDAASAGQKTP